MQSGIQSFAARPPRRVLVVDDDEAIRGMLGVALSEEGYEVVTAPDGAVALERVQEYPPGLILLDMRMPVLDGWAFARAYRQLPAPHAPIVVVSAELSEGAAAEAIGADAFVPKPFDLNEITQVVQQYVAPGRTAW